MSTDLPTNATSAQLPVVDAVLDPVVFGVIPAGPPVTGQPAAWYTLARWEWQPAPQLAE